MATITITANGSYNLGIARSKPNQTQWIGTFGTFGTFGGATVKFERSYDNGVTWRQMQNSSGTAVAPTADSDFQANLSPGLGAILLRCTVTGASGTTNIVVTLSHSSEF